MAGRPSEYDPFLGDEICERLVEGESLRAICKLPHMPAISTVFRWIATFDTFQKQYMSAREAQAETYADEITAIADETPELEPVRDEEGNIIEMRMHAAYVSFQKNRIEARKWVAAKLKPKKYGDKQTVEHEGAITLTPTINLNTNGS